MTGCVGFFLNWYEVHMIYAVRGCKIWEALLPLPGRVLDDNILYYFAVIVSSISHGTERILKKQWHDPGLSIN